MGVELCAQYPHLREYSTSDGLPSSNVYHIFQDRAGLIWVCTDKGLARFNGYDFTTFTTRDNLPSSDVFHLDQDREGRIWLSTINDLCYFENGKFIRLYVDEADGELVFHNIQSDGRHFVNFGNRLFLLEGGRRLREIPIYNTWQQGNFYLTEKQAVEIGCPPSTNRFGPSIYHDGQYFSDTSMYLHKQLEVRGTKFSEGTFVLDENKLFVFGKKEAVVIQGESTERFPLQDEVISVGRLEEHSFFVIYPDSAVVYNDAFEVQHQFDFLKKMDVNHLRMDSHGHLWVGTRDGLYFLSCIARGSQVIDFGLQGVGKSITCMDENEGVIWAGNQKGRLLRWEDDLVQKYTPLELGRKKITCLEYIDQYILLGGKNFLAYDDAKPQRGLKMVQGLETLLETQVYLGAIKSIARTASNDILISGSNGAFLFEKDSNWFQTLSPDRTYAMAQDEDGTIWIGRKNGLARYSDGELSDWKGKHEYFSYEFNDLAVDANGFLWLATNGNGIICFRDSFLYQIPELEKEIVNRINIGEDGLIGLATSRGAAFLRLDSHSPFAYSIKQMSTAHGLPSNEVNDIAMGGDTIFLATSKGLLLLPGSNLEMECEQPELFFEEINIGGSSVALRQDHTLPYDQNNFVLRYTCLSYKSDKQIVYHYKMEGLDEEWKTTAERFKEYTTLPAGEYVFRIKAEDVDHLFTQERAIKFRIHPPFWQTIWFASLVVLAVQGLILAIFRWRENRLKRKAEENRLIDKKMAELELKALQAQMNPHFVFNSLNSIQSFVTQKDGFSANQYLSKFSKLMRLFLESSRKRFIYLSENIEILQLYLELEKLRFDDKFKYHIRVEESLYPSSVEFPSMMVQPFVENAINHGLAYKKGKGLLEIHFYQEANSIICVIEDNGIGRKKAQEINERKAQRGYISRGMQLVEDRRKMLSGLEGININIAIKDKYDEHQQANGTKVTITVPLPTD